MNHYFYKCFDCKTEFSVEEIEPTFQYLCPECGEISQNQPLKGVLQIEYGYSDLRKNISREKFLDFVPGQFWKYPQLWPLEYQKNRHSYSFKNISDEMLNRLCLNSNPLVKHTEDDSSLLFFDDTRSPTLSFKDRASILVALKAIQLNIKEIAAASTGNAASSLAGICARLGLHAHLFVPENIPSAKRIQIQSFGAQLYVVQGNYDQAFDLSIEISNKTKWYNRNTAYNPLTIEGKKSAAYDIFLASKGDVPDVIIVPVGDGVILSGIYKGFWELKKLGYINKIPQLCAVQSEGSDALVRYLKTGRFEYRSPQTIADSISAGAPRNLYMAAEAVKISGGVAVAVSDENILQAQKTVCQQFGLLAEPAAATTLAGYHKLIQDQKISIDQKILLLITGNGLKDIRALESWNKASESHSLDEWKKLLYTE